VNDTVKAAIVGVVAALVPAVLILQWGSAANRRLEHTQANPEKLATASVSNDTYCTPELKAIVRRVASACGLVDSTGGRGCQPMDAQKVAALSGGDFNAMFKPLSKRASILQFDLDKKDLDPAAAALVEKAWSDQRGGSFFFVVARASPDGDKQYNQTLSRDRAQAVLTHLRQTFKDSEIDKQVGMLWLGEEFAQLGDEFCSWNRSREACTPADLNRSAFVAWIDCAI
jgi:outer membrane protein OmpA-like peptidoglycan-associated protein